MRSHAGTSRDRRGVRSSVDQPRIGPVFTRVPDKETIRLALPAHGGGRHRQGSRRFQTEFATRRPGGL